MARAFIPVVLLSVASQLSVRVPDGAGIVVGILGASAAEAGAPVRPACKAPDWIDRLPDSLGQAALGGGSDMPDARLGLLAAMALAREELVSKMKTRVSIAAPAPPTDVSKIQRQAAPIAAPAPPTDVTKMITHMTIVDKQIVRWWTSCDGREAYAVVASRTEGARKPADLQAAFDRASSKVDLGRELPVIPGVVLGLGMGATEAEADDFAWTDLALAVGDEIKRIVRDYKIVDGTKTETDYFEDVSKHTALGVLPCADIPHALVKRWHDASTGLFMSVAATAAGMRPKAEACEKDLNARRDERQASVVGSWRRAQELLPIRPRMARAPLLEAQEAMRHLSSGVVMSRFVSVVRGAETKTEHRLAVSDRSALLDCKALAEEMASATRPLTPLRKLGICKGITVEYQGTRIESDALLDALRPTE